MRTIGEIDKDRNGYVTVVELDDILKLYYEQLVSRELTPIIKKFSSLQNRILIDYKGFRDWVKMECKKMEAIEQLRNDVKSVKSSKSGGNSRLKEKIANLE
jgi:hypothetical protein